MATGVSLWPFFAFVYLENLSFKTALAPDKGWQTVIRRGKKPRNPDGL
jgi:hypothetical protein